MTRTLYFARGLMVGSLLSVGIGLLTYLLFEFYGDNEEGNSKFERSEYDIDAEGRARRKNLMLNADEKAVIEICLSDVTSAISAIAGGATSIELCTNRADGGITPYIGLVDEVVRLTRGKDIQVHVLIRPRAGNFVYSAVEFDVIMRDIIAAKNAGADGIVVGILLENGKLDEDRMAVIRSISVGMFLTFHRAFDVCTNPRQSFETIIKLGCDRLLTSGQSNTAMEGIKLLMELSFLANKRIQILAASNIDATNAFIIIKQSHVNGVNASSSIHSYYDDTLDSSDIDILQKESQNVTTKDANLITEKIISKNEKGIQNEKEKVLNMYALKTEDENNIKNGNNNNDDNNNNNDSVNKLNSRLNLLYGGYDCVCEEKVNELVTIVNTAWLLQSLEKNQEDPAQSITSSLNFTRNDEKKIKSENGSIVDNLSKVNSADFSEDIFLDNDNIQNNNNNKNDIVNNYSNNNKNSNNDDITKIETPVSIDTSYVHVDLESLNKKKSWMWLG